MASKEIAVLVNALKPLYTPVQDGEAKMIAFLSGDAEATASIKKMLDSLGLISIDGGTGEISSPDFQTRQKQKGRCTDPLVVLPNKVASSLTAALERQVAQAAAETTVQEVKPGMKCVRNNCNNVYVDDKTEYECVHCPGAPVFHEGYKYWSCCEKKKHYEFAAFLEAPGCLTEQGCKWFKDVSEERAAKKCRYDHFQTPATIVVTIFAKLCEPGETVVQVNKDSLELTTVYQRQHTFSLKLHLWDEIVPEECSVSLMSTKIDITLKKAGGTWDKLESDE